MRKVLLCNLDLLFKHFDDLNVTENRVIKHSRNRFLSLVDDYLSSTDAEVIFYSRRENLLQNAEKVFINDYPMFQYASRQYVSHILKNRINIDYIIISSKDVDFQMAVRSKILLIVPEWIPHEDKAARYGITVDSPEQLFQFIKVINNQNNWYSIYNIDDHTLVMSLMDARYKYHAWTSDERAVIQNFERLLKQGRSRNFYQILLYHFISGITNTDFFDDIELYGMIPSSDCSLNPEIFKFMQQVRYIKGKRLPHNTMQCENLLIRVHPKQKAHETDSFTRAHSGPEIEYTTLCINQEFSDKIQKLQRTGKLNVCIFDDYMTYGNSFNAARNLLNHLGANKIVFVSLGNFGRPFEKWDYEIQGDVYNVGYRYKLISKKQIQQKLNLEAKNEVAILHNIFNIT